MEVPGVTRHNEQHHSIGATGVVIIDQSTHQVHHSIVLGECPEEREGGGRREEGDSVRTIFSNLHKGGVKTFETWESEE